MGSGEQRGLIMNSVNLTGRTTKDIELKATKSGKDVATFNIAVNEMITETVMARKLFISLELLLLEIGQEYAISTLKREL